MAPLGADLLVDGCAALAGGEDATEISVSLVDLGEQPRWGGSPDGAAPVEAAAAALLLGTAGPPAVAVSSRVLANCSTTGSGMNA